MEFNEMRLFSVFLLAALLAGYPANGAVPRSSEVVTESSDVIEISAKSRCSHPVGPSGKYRLRRQSKGRGYSDEVAAPGLCLG